MKSTIRASNLSSVVLCFLILSAAVTHAQTLTSTFMFVGTGTVGVQAFTNAEIAISTVGLAADVTGSLETGQVSLASQSTSIWISGVGSYQISEPAGLSVQVSPLDVAPGASATQAIDLSVSGQNVVSVTTETTTPWDLQGTYFAVPVFTQVAGGRLDFSPPAGQVQNWSNLPVLTSDGFVLNLATAEGFIPISFQSVRSGGLVCNGTPVGAVADIQTAINEALGLAPATAAMETDGIANIVPVERETEAVLGCGVTVTTPAAGND